MAALDACCLPPAGELALGLRQALRDRLPADEVMTTVTEARMAQ